MDSLQGNPNPVGSIESLKAAGLDPAVYPSCSEPQGFGRNMGCPHWKACIFSFKGDRPRNVAVARVYRVNNSAMTRIKPCYQYMGHDHARRSSDPDTAYAVSIIGHEGDGVKIQTTRKLHEKVEQNCEACREGRCMARITEAVPMTVPAWAPPQDQFAKSEFAAHVMDEMRHKVEREAMASLVGATLPTEGQKPAEKPTEP